MNSLFKSPKYVSGKVAWSPECLYAAGGTDVSSDAASNELKAVKLGGMSSIRAEITMVII